jgi:hypothetical protein
MAEQLSIGEAQGKRVGGAVAEAAYAQPAGVYMVGGEDLQGMRVVGGAGLQGRAL